MLPFTSRTIPIPTGRKDLNVEKLLVWSWLYAYFVTPEQADDLANVSHGETH